MKRATKALLVAAALAAALIPVAAIAGAGFSDVDDSNTFKADIEWMAEVGVTKGCNPPTNDKFCPKDEVRRETMAAFMHRLAINKIVDAKTAVSAETATQAANADTLDFLDSSQFILVGDVKTVTSGSSWLAKSGGTLTHNGGSSIVGAASTEYIMPLVAPASIGDAGFATLRSVKFCVAAASAGSVASVSLDRTEEDGTDDIGAAVLPGSGGLPSPINQVGCYTYTPPTLVEIDGGISLRVVLAGGGTVDLGGVAATWSTLTP